MRHAKISSEHGRIDLLCGAPRHDGSGSIIDTEIDAARRRFHAQAIGVVAGAAALGIGLPGAAGAQIAGVSRSKDEIAFLDLDGVQIPLLAVDGGFPRGDVQPEAPGTGGSAKRIAGVRFPELRIECGLNMPRVLHDWVGAFLSGTDQPRNGTLIIADSMARERQRLQFSDAVLTQAGLSALIAAPRLPGSVELRIQPRTTQFAAGGGGSVSTSIGGGPAEGSFRLRIQGMEQACTYVARIEPLAARRVQSTPNADRGVAREFAKPAAVQLELPNLVIALPEANAGPFVQWFTDFVMRGRNDPGSELPGVLELLDFKQSVMATVSFANLGVFAYGPLPAGDHGLRGRHVRVEMYCEAMSIAPSAGGAAIKPSAPALLKR